MNLPSLIDQDLVFGSRAGFTTLKLELSPSYHFELSHSASARRDHQDL